MDTDCSVACRVFLADLNGFLTACQIHARDDNCIYSCIQGTMNHFIEVLGKYIQVEMTMGVDEQLN